MDNQPQDGTCRAWNHVWMQGCQTCVEEKIAQRVYDWFMRDEYGAWSHEEIGEGLLMVAKGQEVVWFKCGCVVTCKCGEYDGTRN